MAFFHHYFPLTLIIPAILHGQPQSTLSRPASIQVNSDLVLINALVTDERGAVVTGLGASAFRLFESGKEQVVKYCLNEDVPVSIGLVLDTSSSMSGKLALLKQAAVEFVRVGNASDEYFLIEFRNRPRLVLPLTRDLDQVTQSVGQLQAGGNTALLDALYLAVSEIQHTNNPRKALLLISDGLDNHSRYTESETRKLISELDVPIYTINLYESPSGNRYAIQRQNPGILEAISTATGGRTFRELSPKKLSSVAKLIASEIRHEYILGYVPSNRTRDGKFRHVHVLVEALTSQKIRISHREGYHAPAR